MSRSSELGDLAHCLGNVGDAVFPGIFGAGDVDVDTHFC
jgi:hypothetical protein